MIKISAKKENIDKTELLFVKQMEMDVSSFVKRKLTKDNSDLSVLLDFEIIEKQDKTVMIETNAAFSIAGSLSIVEVTKRYIEQNCDLYDILQQHSLIIHISFRQNHEK